jgi:hypothetical protein
MPWAFLFARAVFPDTVPFPFPTAQAFAIGQERIGESVQRNGSFPIGSGTELDGDDYPGVLRAAMILMMLETTSSGPSMISRRKVLSTRRDYYRNHRKKRAFG